MDDYVKIEWDDSISSDIFNPEMSKYFPERLKYITIPSDGTWDICGKVAHYKSGDMVNIDECVEYSINKNK
jgi:hypothetical protein